METQSLILVVDDQPVGQMVLASLLEPEGYRLAFAANGPEALTQMQLMAPDLVLLDVMMPEMDGFEVCRRIRADPNLALIPVVMVTALDDQNSLIQGIEAGADDFVSKPFSRAELRTRIRTITRLNRFRTLLDEQRRAARSRAQLLWAIEHASDGYLLLDAHDQPQDGNSSGWNYLNLTGPPEATLLAPFLTLVQQHYRLEPADAWASWPQPTHASRYLVRSEGADTLWLQVKVFDRSDDGAEQRIVHLRDVTTQLVTQRNIWAFHGFVSHKLRTPLTTLVTGMSLLQRQSAELSSDSAMLVGLAYEGAQRLKAVVDGIFRYLETPLACDATTGALVADLPAVITTLAQDLGLSNVQLTTHLQSDTARLVLSMPTLELLVSELIENAHKFHPTNQPEVGVTLSQQENHVRIQVCDNGRTLTASQLRRFWEPYQQIDPDFTGQIQGLGLGLATIAQICWTVGGHCHVANHPEGPGICIVLAVPLSNPE
ncbi:MAG: response regulator [Candidatus Viridilinea halotolerans]|uniref:histidine kinase n=1 Tax=Candidatus Viridilinea halotolerans TaxID=2491704 RepID=A0A426TZF7_9CHLR|nr:MAG: response regulator [Candidatus Viridilinea halotolerans]